MLLKYYYCLYGRYNLILENQHTASAIGTPFQENAHKTQTLKAVVLLWYHPLTRCCVAAAAADSEVFVDIANSFPYWASLCALAKLLLWTSTNLPTLACHQKDPVHKTQDMSNSASGLSNCSTNKTIQRQYSLLCKDLWLLNFSNRELKIKQLYPKFSCNWGGFVVD